MLGTYTRVPDGSGWGVIVQVDEAKAYYTALRMRNQSIVLVAIVTLLALVLGTLFAGQISRPIQKLARGCSEAGRRRVRHPCRRAQQQRGRRPRRGLQPDGRGDPEGDRRGPPPGGRQQGAVHGLDPHAGERHRREGPLHARPFRARRLLLGHDREALGHVARGSGEGPRLGHHPRRRARSGSRTRSCASRRR